MAAGHLVTGADLALLRNLDADLFVYSGRQFSAVFTGKHLRVYYDTGFPMGNTQGTIPFFTGLFIKYRSYQTFFRG